MRQIKFRAWDTKDKKYLFSDKQEFICTTHQNGFGVTIPFDIDGFIDSVQGIDWSDADLITGRYELEQFTGTYDKNGKEIYEGDIIQTDIGAREIGWNNEYSRFGFRENVRDGFYTFCRLSNFEVIGNIHENEELLHEA